MKHVKMGIAIFLVLTVVSAIFAGCSASPNEMGEISEFDSESYIPVSGTDNQPGNGSATGFVVRDREYDYRDGDNRLIVLQVENQTDKNYTITINGQYLDKNGSILKEENQTFEGFEAGWKNYFFFVPEIPFERFTYTLETEEYSGECYASALQYTWSFEENEMGIPWDDWHRDEASYEAALSRGENVPPPPTYFVPQIVFKLNREFTRPVNKSVSIRESIVFINEQDEVIDAWVGWYTGTHLPINEGEKWANQKPYYDFPDPDNREWPEELKGNMTVLISVLEAKEYSPTY